MSFLMETDLKILQDFESFIKGNEYKLKFLKDKLKEYEKDHDIAASQGQIYYENPVNRFMLTKRLTNDWEKVENIMLHEEGKDILVNMQHYSLNETEYEGGIDGFLRLQDTYRLKTSDMVQGILQGVKYNTHLEAEHCYDIGKRASAKKYPRLSYHWLQEALKRFKKSKFGNKLKKSEIQLSLANTKYLLGDIPGANQTYIKLKNLYPKCKKIAKKYTKFLRKSSKQKIIAVDYTLEHEPIIEDEKKICPTLAYKYTCAGILKQTPSEQRNLHCRYLNKNHPFLLLAPFKVEELNHDPLVMVYHNVVSDHEIDTMKNLTINMKRAKTRSKNGSIISDLRTSQCDFLEAGIHPVLSIIDQRVEDMTKLNMKYVENHQFANYGIGGHYGQHYDYFSERTMKTQNTSLYHMGNRIATVLFYLTDVEQGGGTAFPILKLHLQAKKGSAVFWFNLHASGKRDLRTKHAACPIIVGSKWVLNRWIRENDQSDRRPCLLYDDSIY